jgi:hypothetical protein
MYLRSFGPESATEVKTPRLITSRWILANHNYTRTSRCGNALFGVLRQELLHRCGFVDRLSSTMWISFAHGVWVSTDSGRRTLAMAKEF